MPTSKWLQIDGEEYQVAVIALQRSGDILDLEANRSEDGVLHRDQVIGTFYNYQLGIIAPSDPALYERLWWKITEPVGSHSVQLPYQTSPFDGYFSSIKDNVKLIKSDGTIIGTGISCKLTAMSPSRTPE